MEIKRRRSSSPLDLPQHLMEQILERLPFTDYIRSAAVCRSWKAIQKEHRLCHSKRASVVSPPTLPIPWLIMPSAKPDSTTILCYSPLEKKNNILYRYSLQLPDLKGMRCLASSHGWLLLASCSTDDIYMLEKRTLFLLNPITGRKIQLPQLKDVELLPVTAALSCSPTDESNECVVMIISIPHVFLCRVGVDTRWTWFYRCRDISTMILMPKGRPVTAPIFCGGKFYCRSDDRRTMVVVEPSPKPALDFIEMDASEIPPTHDLSMLVESNGEILLVAAPSTTESSWSWRRHMMKGFLRVFKADLTKKMWVKVESLRDRLLIVGLDSSASLAAGGSRAGNRIYFSLPTRTGHWSGRHPWREFDMDSGRMILIEEKEPISNKNVVGWKLLQQLPSPIWIVPSLD